MIREDNLIARLQHHSKHKTKITEDRMAALMVREYRPGARGRVADLLLPAIHHQPAAGALDARS